MFDGEKSPFMRLYHQKIGDSPSTKHMDLTQPKMVGV